MASIHYYFARKQLGDTQKPGNPRCTVHAEIHSICTARPRPGPAAGVRVSPTSDTCQSVAILRQDLEAILVIFGPTALIFVFWSKALGKKWRMTLLLCACAVVITLETQKCRKRAPRSVEFNFFFFTVISWLLAETKSCSWLLSGWSLWLEQKKPTD